MVNVRTVAATVAAALLAACSGTVTSTPDGGASVPATPSGVTATAGIRSATLVWTAPSSDGGSALLGYRVEISPATPAAAVTITGTTASVSGLANGTTYTFTVSAFNAVGAGPSSAPSNAITTPDVPGAPTGVVAVAGDQTASLTWVAPTATGGRPVTGYTVVVTPSTASAQVVVNGTSATVTGLVNGTAYTFTVAAVNAVGTGPQSSPSSPVTPMALPPGTPSAPNNVTATPGVGRATVSWTAPTSSGTSAIQGYTVSVLPAPGPPASVSITGTTATVTGLASGATYSFAVAAFNASGTGPPALSNPVTTPTVPGAPTNVVPSAGDQSASLSWTAPASNGGSPVTGYVVAISPPAPQAQVVVNGTSATVTGLVNGTAYTFTVAAVNAVGTGPQSSPSSPVTPMALPPGTPSAPNNVTATPGVGGATVSWTAPTSSGTSAIQGYTVNVLPAPTPPASVSITGTRATVTGLASGATYSFAVAAFNASGTGPSALSNPVTTPTVPGAPTNVVPSAGDQSASLSWTAPASNGGSP